MDGDTSLFSLIQSNLFIVTESLFWMCHAGMFSLFFLLTKILAWTYFFYTIGGPGRLASPPGFSFMNQRAFFRKNEIKIKQQPKKKHSFFSVKLH
jgi:hypothetical protein